MKFDPYAHDPGRWGASLVNLTEIMLPCLDAAGARSVVEVGAYAGDLTAVLVDWAADRGARVWAIDPSPQPALVELDERSDNLELVRATSLDALPRMEPTDAVVIDGDHNYFTVSEELRLIAERAAGGDLPLLLFHDVCWPHGRRDDYYDPDAIPAEHRQPIAPGGGLFPGHSEMVPGGLPYRAPAAHEGGPRNGVLTAAEDFVAGHGGLRLAVVPAFFGLGVVWRADAPWADAVAAIVEPWDSNPLLERLERNRVHHLASTHQQMVEVSNLRQRCADQERLLREFLKSKSFDVAERLSRIRQGGDRGISKEEIREVLGE
jgi:hypothetical protein